MKHPQHEMPETTDIYNIVSMLWKRAAPQLSKNELEWFRKSGEAAQVSLGNFATVLNVIGANAMYSERAFKSDEAVSRLLFFFSDYVRYLETMVCVASSAGDRLLEG